MQTTTFTFTLRITTLKFYFQNFGFQFTEVNIIAAKWPNSGEFHP